MSSNDEAVARLSLQQFEPAMDSLDALTDAQRSDLQQFCALTGNEDIESAVNALNASGWDLQLAASKVFDGSSSPAFEQPAFEPLEIDDTAQGPPRRTAQARNQPNGPADQLWFRIRPYLRGPFALFRPLFFVLSTALSLVARLLRIRPNFSSLSFRGATRGAVAADPASCAERFIRGLEEQAGARGLPRFERCGYEEALRKAQREVRPMLAVLISDEHDDTPEFSKNVLTDPDLLACLSENEVVVWGGDIRDRDAHITSQTLEATTYPFVACIALQPARSQPGMPAPAAQAPKMTLFSRLEGSPTTVTSAAAILAHLRSTFLPRTSPYLSRIRNENLARDAERRLRAEQDAAYAAAGQRDAEKIAKKRAEVAAAQTAEQRARQREQWRRWAATSLGAEPTTGGARLAVKLPDGRRLVRRFAEESTSISDVYRWIEAEAFAGATQGDSSFPSGYQHQYDFKVAQMIPRRALDVEGAAGSRTLASVGGFAGGANLAVEGLKLSTGQDDDSTDEEIE